MDHPMPPAGTIALFQELLRRLGTPGISYHCDIIEAEEDGSVRCRASLFTAENRYDLTAIQPAAPNWEGSRLMCFTRSRKTATVSHRFPRAGVGPEFNLLDDIDHPLDEATFELIMRRIVANEMVVLDGVDHAPRRRKMVDHPFAGTDAKAPPDCES